MLEVSFPDVGGPDTAPTVGTFGRPRRTTTACEDWTNCVHAAPLSLRIEIIHVPVRLLASDRYSLRNRRQTAPRPTPSGVMSLSVLSASSVSRMVWSDTPGMAARMSAIRNTE